MQDGTETGQQLAYSPSAANDMDSEIHGQSIVLPFYIMLPLCWFILRLNYCGPVTDFFIANLPFLDPFKDFVRYLFVNMIDGHTIFHPCIRSLHFKSVFIEKV